MEIIARLREEREILVARVTQIDKMLHQYDAWGREAQLLLSLTAAARPDSGDGPAFATGPKAVLDTGVSDQQKYGKFGKMSTRERSSLPVQGAKTPIREFEAAVIDVLRENDLPMNRIALYDALTARGIVIGDGQKDKELNALSARVYRMAQGGGPLISEQGQGYSLRQGDEFGDDNEQDSPSVNDFDGSDLV